MSSQATKSIQRVGNLLSRASPNKETRLLGRFTPDNMNLIRGRSLDQVKKRVCTDRHVIFHNGYDNFIGDKFPYATTVFFNNCEKNFVYYNLNKRLFPNLKKFYCNSHPCEYETMHRFSDDPEYVGYLTPSHYHHYLDRWWNAETKHVKEIPGYEYELFLGTFDQVEPTFDFEYIDVTSEYETKQPNCS